MTRDACRRGGPPWWPANEPWPPRHGRFVIGRQARARFFRRMALIGVGILGVGVAGVFAAAWVLAQMFGASASAAALAAVIILFAGGILLVSVFGPMRRFVSPLGELMDAADRVADGDYGLRVRENGPPPMRALARSFNAMTERLQNADRSRRNLMADLAHELRTPLTVLQGRLEGLLDGVYPRDDRQIADLLDETQVLSRLIEDLRTLALSDTGALPLQREPTNVTELARDVVRSMDTEARQKPVTLTVNAPADEIVADLDPMRIREVIVNLVSNAIRHTPADGAVTLSLSTTNGFATVTVADTGAGLAPDEIGRMFERFYKGEASRGSGLGLAIAKGIVIAHGGRIAATSEPGRGTAVTFTIPRSVNT